MNIVRDLKYGEKPLNNFDLYIPDNKDFTTIVYFHGGGIESGDKSNPQYQEIMNSFMKAGYGVANVNYTLYPNTKFPIYLEECAKAVAYVKKEINKYEGSGKIVITGQSAGAWMTAMLLFATKYLKAEGIDASTIDGWIVESGQMTSHFNIITFENKLHPFAQRIDEKAPLYFIDQNTNFTKALFIYYDKDMPMRKEQNVLLYKTVKAFNNDSDIELLELPGTHCYGSSFKEEDGEYRYVKESLNWLARKGI